MLGIPPQIKVIQSGRDFAFGSSCNRRDPVIVGTVSRFGTSFQRPYYDSCRIPRCGEPDDRPADGCLLARAKCGQELIMLRHAA
jgi:hypothetical protein